MTSVGPPGGNGTISRMGRAGYASSAAVPGAVGTLRAHAKAAIAASTESRAAAKQLLTTNYSRLCPPSQTRLIADKPPDDAPNTGAAKDALNKRSIVRAMGLSGTNAFRETDLLRA